MPYKFFSSSKKAWRAMFDSISKAEESVYLEMYIFANDLKQFDFLELLRKKAESGVRVRVVLDYFGSFMLTNSSIAELREAGAEVIFLSYFLHRTHRKILIVDEKVAFVGGVNFHKEAWLWNDLVIEVRGKLVLSITRSFARMYAEVGGQDPLLLEASKKAILKRARAWLVEHFPVKQNPSLKNIYKDYLGEAKESIILVTPYFMPKRWFIGVLHQAVLRGVNVEILVPKRGNHFIPDRVGYFFMHKLSKLGVKFYLQNKMNHAKLMIIDGREGMVGSNNLDFLSFELNSEVGVFLKDKAAVKKLLVIAEDWRSDAKLFEFSHYKPKLFDYALSPVISIFARIF